MTKTRGLTEAREKLGDLPKIISQILKKKSRIKILEVGCGYGKVMMELTRLFGNKIDIIGMNLKQKHGSRNKMIDFAIQEGIFTPEKIKKIKIPKIIYGDAGEKLPIKSKSIDLVISQVTVMFFKDKIHFYEEVARVLKKNGIALISGHNNYKVQEQLGDLLKIHDKEKQIAFKDYIKKFKLIKYVKMKTGANPIQIQSGKLKFNLKLKSTKNINKLNKEWFGTQSIYELN